MYICMCNWVPMLYIGRKKCVGGNNHIGYILKIYHHWILPNKHCVFVFVCVFLGPNL